MFIQSSKFYVQQQFFETNGKLEKNVGQNIKLGIIYYREKSQNGKHI